MVRPLTASSSESVPCCGGAARGYVEQNVAGEGIEGALPAMPAVKEHFRALPYLEVDQALEAVQESRVSEAAKRCLRFLVLTAARSGEARGATWAEVDTEAREWRIPGERMKGAESTAFRCLRRRATCWRGRGHWRMGVG